MGDERRLRDLIDRGGDRSNWRESTRSGTYYVGRNLMMRLGGFDAMCLAEQDELQEWLDTKLSSQWAAYHNKRCISHIYDFLVEEGVIGANPARSLKIVVPSREDIHRRPAMDLKDVRKLFGIAKRESFTVEGAKNYLVLCLRLRCAVQYTAMAKCRVSDLELGDTGGVLLVYDSKKRRQVLHSVDQVTADAIRNYLDIRGPYSSSDPLIAKNGYRGCKAGGFYKGAVLQERVRTLCGRIGVKVGEYSLEKTVVMLAYAEGADIVQATAVAATESLTLAARIAEDLDGVDPIELRRKLLGEIDSSEPVASGMIRAEEIIDAVSAAYRVPSLRIVIGADGWAKIELPGND